MGATLIKVDIKTGSLRRTIDVLLAQFDTNVTISTQWADITTRFNPRGRR